MIFFDDSTVKVGGVVPPGVFKSLEIKTAAQIEEADMEGKSKKPKQATGYEDAKINLELQLENSPEQSALDKLKVIQNLFRKRGQEKPIIHEIVNEHTAIRNISKVVFKDLTTKTQNKKTELSVSLEFWEYVAITITATKKDSSNRSKTNSSKSNSTKNTKSNSTSNSNTSSSSNLNENYKNYLQDRGKAPKIQSKTSKTAATDSSNASKHLKKLK